MFNLGDTVRMTSGHKATIVATYEKGGAVCIHEYTVRVNDTNKLIDLNGDRLKALKRIVAYCYQHESGLLRWATSNKTSAGVKRRPELDFIQYI